MTLNLLAICVGNSRTRVGVFTDDKLAASRALPNTSPTDAAATIAPDWDAVKDLDEPSILIASVNPDFSKPLTAALAQRLPGAKIARIEKDVPIPIGRQLDPEALPGDDRLLNAAAAYDTLKQACVIVDAGTAITIDFVDGAGTFHGGAIVPGAKMMLDALHAGTALLPAVSLARPIEPVGHNTVEAMRTGVFHGVRGMVRELVEQYAEAAGLFPLVVVTGGDAPLLFDGYDLVDRVVPDLTLMGMAVSLRTALSEDA